MHNLFQQFTFFKKMRIKNNKINLLYWFMYDSIFFSTVQVPYGNGFFFLFATKFKEIMAYVGTYGTDFGEFFCNE